MDCSTLSLTIDGEYIAYCAMKSALEEIVELGEKPAWEVDRDKVVEIAKSALACEERLGS